MAQCYNCGNEFERDFAVHRSTICPACGRDVRVCKNCLFYAPGAHWDCRETIPEAVLDKERANFCDYFRLNRLQGDGQADSRHKDAESKARDRFAGLFGDD